MNGKTSTRWIAAATLSGLALVACGGGDDGDSTATTTGGTTAAAPATTGAPVPTVAPSTTPAPATTPPPDTAAPSTTAPAGAYPVVLDNCGVELTFDQRPERVLLLNGSSFSESTTMAALGLADTVIANGQVPMGVTDGDPSIAELVAAMPTGGLETDSATFEVTRESLLAARPDLVISVWSGGFQGDFGAGISREELLELGINTYVSRGNCGYGTDFQTLPDIGHEASYELIEDLGIIFDARDEAEALIADQQELIAEVRERTSARAEPVRTMVFSSRFAEFWPNGLGSINTFPVTNAVLESAGAVNAFDDFQVSREQMVATQVDFVVIYQTEPGDPAAEFAVLQENFPEWNAVKNEAWVAVSDGIYFGATQHLAVAKIADAIDAVYPIE